jgi:hypothetical protein
VTKQKLRDIVADGAARRKGYFALKIETEGNAAPEIIVNPFENAGAKMAYIERVYNDELELISAKECGMSIRIVDAAVFSSFAGLEWFVV